MNRSYATGALGGAGFGLAAAANVAAARGISTPLLMVYAVVGACVGAPALSLARAAALRGVSRLPLGAARSERYARLEWWTYLVVLAPLLGVVGVQMVGPAIAAMFGVWVVMQAALIIAPIQGGPPVVRADHPLWLPAIFFLSGFAALIYQVVWQRVLFVALGVDIQSVTLIVSIFMLGLGLGSLLGGHLSVRFRGRLPQVFMAAELGVALFGVASVTLIGRGSELVQGRGLVAMGVAVFALLLVPTMLMGMTLPVLVAYVDRRLNNVGRSVGLLYFVNTLGSALASAFTVDVTFAFTGLRQATWMAAAINAAAAALVLMYARAAGDR